MTINKSGKLRQLNKNIKQDGLVEHLFRHEYGRILATLLKQFGAQNIKLAEDAIQEAFLRALGNWPLKGTPENPGGWLQRVAGNAVIDYLRKSRTQSSGRGGFTESAGEGNHPDSSSHHFVGEVQDDLLAMMFSCCSPLIPVESQVIVSLKWLSGFSTRDISKALLESEDVVSQRISRARGRMARSRIKPEIPSGRELYSCLPSVQQVLYLLFNEGYASSQSERLIRRELCFEAIRLTRHLLDCRETAQPSTYALMALFCFHAARLDTRLSDANELLLLADQDRRKWDRVLIAQGTYALRRARSGDELTRYHLEAGIASCHAAARTFDETNWEQIAALYEQLQQITRSPVVSLNYATAISYRDGLPEAEAVIARLQGNKKLERYYLYWAVLADFARRRRGFQEAIGFYRRALTLSDNVAERSFLERRLAECQHHIS